MFIKEERLFLVQLYSGDEIDFFWKLMLENIQVSRKDICLFGRKINKERLFVFLCVNVDGIYKLKLIIIGKLKLFKSVKKDISILFVIYKFSKDVWFIRELFFEWFF